VKLPGTPKETPNQAGEPGKAKVGRVNESESLQASSFEVIETLVETMMTGHIRSEVSTSLGANTSVPGV
jgi:hypothetical protein